MLERERKFEEERKRLKQEKEAQIEILEKQFRETIAASILAALREERREQIKRPESEIKSKLNDGKDVGSEIMAKHTMLQKPQFSKEEYQLNAESNYQIWREKV
jgi:hypothetical protein